MRILYVTPDDSNAHHAESLARPYRIPLIAVDRLPVFPLLEQEVLIVDFDFLNKQFQPGDLLRASPNMVFLHTYEDVTVREELGPLARNVHHTLDKAFKAALFSLAIRLQARRNIQQQWWGDRFRIHRRSGGR